MPLVGLKTLFLPCILILLSTCSILAQRDTIVATNGEIVIGDVKKMELGVLTIETDYSEDDFKISWTKVKSISTSQYMRVFNDNGALLIGKLSSDTLSKHLIIHAFAGTYERPLLSIISLSDVENKFIDKLSLGLNIGYTYTKASNTGQVSIRGNAGYEERKWRLTGSMNVFNSRIDTSVIARGDASVALNIFLARNWYALTSLSFNWSDEQMIDLRTVASLGIGNYLVKNHRMILALEGGATFNNEKFQDEGEPVNRSAELYGGFSYNLYGNDKLSMLANAKAYPSLTDSDRIRVNCDVDFTYDLTDDFNLTLGYTLNFDSNPPNNAQNSDYVFSLTFGWEL